MKKRNKQEKSELRRGLGTGSSVSLSAVGLLLMFFIPWMVYQQGAGAGWIAIGSFVGLLVLWSMDSYRLMRFSLQQEKHVTLPGFFSKRYHEHYPVLRIFFTVVLVLFLWLVGTLLLSGIADFAGELLGLGRIATVFGIVLISMGLYFLFGRAGFSAADRWIAALVMFSLVVIIYAIFRVLGINRILENIFHSWAAGSVSEYVNVGFMGGKRLSIPEIISLFSFGFLILGNPLCLQGFEQADRARTIHRSRRWAIIFSLISLFLSVIAGGMLRASLYPARIGSMKEFFHMILEEDQGRGFLFHLTGITFVITAGLVAMEIFHTCLLQLAQIIYDNPVTMWYKMEKGKISGKGTLILVMVFSEIVVAAGALQCGEWIYPVTRYACIIVSCGLAPAVILSLHVRWMNIAGCLGSFLFGALFAGVWELGAWIPKGGSFVTLHDLTGISGIIPAMLIGAGLGILLARLTHAPSKKVTDAYEEVQYRLITVDDKIEQNKRSR